MITTGGEAINRIKQIKADLCFLGINAIDQVHGITDIDWDIVQLKKSMIESSQKVISLTISEKVNTFQPFKICDVTDIDMLITELPANDKLLRPYRKSGVEVL